MSLESMKHRLAYEGGGRQQDRMINDKLKSMLSATKYSYQAAKFERYPDGKAFPGLFNSASQNEDRDIKKISCENDLVRVGNIIKWTNQDSFWIIFLQDRTELAHFRGSCRRCDYFISWVNKDRKKISTPAAIIGPTNPQLSSRMTSSTQIDLPTGNIVVLVSNTDPNREFFTIDQHFIIRGRTYKIQQVDTISMPGVIQIDALQSYNNRVEDDPKEGLVNKWNVQAEVEHHTKEYVINGPRYIKPYYEATYYTHIKGGQWIFKDWDSRYSPMEFLTDTITQTVTLAWKSPKSGNFTLMYVIYDTEGNIAKQYELNIIVESMM